MRLRLACLFFPLLVVLLMIGERIATFLLGVDPGVPQLWALSLELRAIFRPSVQWMSLLTSGYLTAELLFLVTIAASLLAMMHWRSWQVASFLANSGTLAFVAIMIFAPSRSVLASNDDWFAVDWGAWAAQPQLEALQFVVLGAGIAGCVASHVALLTRHNASRRAVMAGLQSLASAAGTPRTR